jgi:DNA-binding FadR family transcriptional regulator
VTASHVNADHQAILDAIRDADLGAAESAVSAHLLAIRDRMTANLMRDGGRM